MNDRRNTMLANDLPYQNQVRDIALIEWQLVIQQRADARGQIIERNNVLAAVQRFVHQRTDDVTVRACEKARQICRSIGSRSLVLGRRACCTIQGNRSRQCGDQLRLKANLEMQIEHDEQADDHPKI